VFASLFFLTGAGSPSFLTHFYGLNPVLAPLLRESLRVCLLPPGKMPQVTLSVTSVLESSFSF